MKAKIKALKETSERRLSIKEKILNLIKDVGNTGITEYQIKARLQGVKRATIIARLSELMDDGIIEVVGTFNNGNNSIYSFVSDNEKRIENAIKRENERFERWKKIGNEKGYFEKITIDDLQKKIS